MGAIIAIISALMPLTGVIATLFKDVMGFWQQFHNTTGIDPNAVANDAIGAAQAFTTLDKTVEHAIVDTTAHVTKNFPSIHPAHATVISAMAVHQAHNTLTAAAASKAP